MNVDDQIFLLTILTALFALGSALIAFAGETYVKGETPLISRIKFAGWMSIICIVGAFITGTSEKVLTTRLQEAESTAAKNQIGELKEELKSRGKNIVQLQEANKEQTLLLTSLENANITSRIQVENDYVELVKENGWVDTINPKFKVLFMLDVITHDNLEWPLQMAYDVSSYYYKVTAVDAQGTEVYMPNENVILRFKTKEFWDDVNKEINRAVNIAKLDVTKIDLNYWVCGDISYTSKAGIKANKKMILGNQHSSESREIKKSSAHVFCEKETKKSDRGWLDMNVLSYDILKFFKPNNNYDFSRS